MIVCFSGKKRSGKNTSANYLVGKYLVATGQIADFCITAKGLLQCTVDGRNSEVIPEGELTRHGFSGVRLYSFADPLKQFCMDVFGLTDEQCYGTEDQKNSLTTLRWEQMPSPTGRLGFMTAREVLQYFGTNVVRRMFGNAWVWATLAAIRRDNPKLAIVTDGRFPNEIEGVMRAGGKTVRLLRNVCGSDVHESETALDDYPADGFSLVMDNQNMSVQEQNQAFDSVVAEWLEEMPC